METAATRQSGAEEAEGFTLDPLRTSPTYRIVADTIEEAIMDGRMRPGAQLPTETALAAQLGINRSTAREGLRLLEQSGLVARSASRRLHVAVPGYEELSTRAGRALLLRKVSFAQLHRLLMVLEPEAAAQAATAIGEDDLAALEANVAATAAAVTAGESVTALDIEFHDILGRATGNPAWIVAREPAARLLYPASDPMMRALPQAASRLLAAHRAVYEAVRAGDAAGAEAWMRRHVEDFRRGYELAGFDFDRPVQTMDTGHANVAGQPEGCRVG